MAKNSSKNTPETTITVVEEKGLEADVGTILTPQQALFLQLYFDRESPTWGNAKQSAIRAGFSEEYANTITYLRPKWLSEFIGQRSLISKIEAHFDEVMNMPNVSQAMGAFGPIEKTEIIIEETGEVYKSGKKKGQKKTRKVKIKTPVMVPNISLIKAKNEVAKIAAPAHDPERYGKKAGNTNKFVFNMGPIKEKYRTWWNIDNS